jgi:hypothetical protein
VSSAGLVLPAPARRIRGEAVAATVDAGTWPHTRRVLPWSIAGFVVMLWTIPFNAISLPVALPMDAKLDRPALAAIGALWLATVAVASKELRPRLRFGRVHVAIGLFFIAAVGSLLLNAGTLGNLGELELGVKKLVLLISYVFFFLVAASVIRPEEVPAFARFNLALAAIVSFMTVLEYRVGFNPFYGITSVALPGMVAIPGDLGSIDYSGRLTIYGAMDHPLELALMIGLVLPLAVIQVLDASERRERFKRIALAGLLMAGIFSTQRKTGLIGTGVSILFILAYRPRSLRRLIPVGIGLMLVLHVLAPGTMGGLKQQLQPQHLTGTNSTAMRADDYDAVAPDIRHHPSLGRGYGTYDGLKYRILDNQYLGLLVTVGFVGTVAYLFMLLSGVTLTHAFVRGRRHGPVSGSLLLAFSAGVVSFVVGSALFDVLSFPHVTYHVFFILALMVAATRPAAAGSGDGVAARQHRRAHPAP